MNKKIVRILCIVLAVLMLAAFLPSLAGASEGTLDVTIQGRRMYSYAYEVLNSVNQYRAAAGLSALTMDETLLSVAMQRAAELTINYSHTRPDGARCFSGYPDALLSTRAAENIAFGYDTPAEVMDGWMNSPGHHANIMDAEEHSIGIGCFYADGAYYWSQNFSGYTGSAASVRSDADTTEIVRVRASWLELSVSGGTNTLKAGETTTCELLANYHPLAPASLTFTSSDNAVASVNANGLVTALAPGKATIAIMITGTGYGAEFDLTVTSGTVLALFNAAGGNVYYAGKEVLYGLPYGDLPEAERDGYEFVGWFTSPAGGTAVTENTLVAFDGEHTLYAHWERRQSADASLTSLEVGGCALFPAFDPNAVSYSGSVPYENAAVLVSAAAVPGASIEINGAASASAGVPLEVGENMVYVYVTAEDGVGSRLYIINISRAEREPLVVIEPQPDAPAYSGFTDVDEDAWYGARREGVVSKAVRMGVMQGYEDGSFRPSGDISVAEVVTMAVRIYERYTFGEVKTQVAHDSQWYSDFVLNALEYGIIQPRDRFNYDAAATRAQMAYVFANCLPYSELEPINSIAAIYDMSAEDEYFGDVLALYQAGVVRGSSALGAFEPYRPILRSEVAAIAVRLCDADERIALS